MLLLAKRQLIATAVATNNPRPIQLLAWVCTYAKPENRQACYVTMLTHHVCNSKATLQPRGLTPKGKQKGAGCGVLAGS